MDRGKAPAHSSISGDGYSAVFQERFRILLVDSNPVSRQIAEMTLLECNNQVTACSTGTEALAILVHRKGEFDAVMTDVRLLDINGFEFVQCVHAKLQLPVVVMIAEGDAEAMTKITDDEVCSVLGKPVRKDAVTNALEHVADRKLKEVNRSCILQPTISEDRNPPWREQNPNLNLNPNNAMRRKRQRREELGQPRESSTGQVKKQRVVWDVSLHRKFVTAVESLPPREVAPKKILEKMNCPLITRASVASHLQKYRKQRNAKAAAADQKKAEMISTAAPDFRTRNISSQYLSNNLSNQNLIHCGVMNTQSQSSLQPIFPNQALYHSGNFNNLCHTQLGQLHHRHPSQNPVFQLNGSRFNNSQDPQQALIYPRHNTNVQLNEQVAYLAHMNYLNQRSPRQQQMFLDSQHNHSQVYAAFSTNNSSALSTMANNITPSNTSNGIARSDSTNLNTARSMVVGAPQLLHDVAEFPIGWNSLSSNIGESVHGDLQIMADNFGVTSNFTSLLSKEAMFDDLLNRLLSIQPALSSVTERSKIHDSPSSFSHTDSSVNTLTDQEENQLVSNDIDTKDDMAIFIHNKFGLHYLEDIVHGVDFANNEKQNDLAHKEKKGQEKKGEADPQNSFLRFR